MFTLLKRLVFIAFILIFALIPGRDLIPEEYEDNVVLEYMDESFKRINSEVVYAISPLRAYINPVNITRKIIELDEKQVYRLLVATQNRSKVVMLYLYSLDCQLCKINFSDIMKISNKYKDKGLLTLAVAVEGDKSKLADFLKTKIYNMNFKPLMIHPDKDKTLRGLLSANSIYYAKAPSIIVGDKNGTFSNVTPGFMKRSKIEARIKTVLGIK